MALLAMAGCGGASKKEPIDFGEALEPRAEPAPEVAPTPAPAPLADATCAQAAANVTALTRHVSPALGRAVGDRCQGDGWATDVVQCFAAAPDGPGLSLCMALLPMEQQKAIETQSVAVVRASDPACDRVLLRKPVPASAAPASAEPAAPASAETPGLPRVPGAPAVVSRTVGAKELEQLRLSGQTQLEPPASERRLMEQCGVSRVVVSLKLCIDAAGVPSSVELVSASRLPAYEAQLAEAVDKWRYRPYLVESRPSAVCGPVTFAFSLAR